jgi:hypothetical protein
MRRVASALHHDRISSAWDRRGGWLQQDMAPLGNGAVRWCWQAGATRPRPRPRRASGRLGPFRAALAALAAHPTHRSLVFLPLEGLLGVSARLVSAGCRCRVVLALLARLTRPRRGAPRSVRRVGVAVASWGPLKWGLAATHRTLMQPTRPIARPPVDSLSPNRFATTLLAVPVRPQRCTSASPCPQAGERCVRGKQCSSRWPCSPPRPSALPLPTSMSWTRPAPTATRQANSPL